jgi:arylsulfatase
MAAEHEGHDQTRREFLGLLAAGAATAAVAGAAGVATAAPAPAPAAPAIVSGRRPPNIVLVFSDQERYFRSLPKGYTLPGHERLQSRGVTFANHYGPAVMCTSSRAVLMTGLQTADNGMYENVDAPWVGSLSTRVPTLGHLLRQAGYYTAYKGKWHLNKEFESSDPDRMFTTEMEAYGFADYAWPGDVLAHALGGYRYDHLIAGSAVSWLRRQGRALADEGRPWALVVSLVNPHDIMYFNSDAPGMPVQHTGNLMMQPALAPPHPDYARKWHAPLPANLRQRFDEPGRPRAHGEFDRAWGYTLGRMPHDEARWQRFSDYYLNCLRAVDAQFLAIQAELDALRLADRTVVAYTSDHGEMGGAHGLRGKGAFVYEECTHVPLLVSHPDVRGGADCRALTSHIDLVPSLLAMGGMSATRRAEAAGRELPGHDISPALARRSAAGVHDVRESVLFTYSGLAQNDSELMRVIAEGAAAGKDVKTAVKESGFKPDLTKRGSVRMAFDGRYKYARYFAPLERHRPTTVEEIRRRNDVELYDLRNDPGEMRNLAAPRIADEALLLAMNDKLNAAIAAEIGRDDGREMPDVAGIQWDVDRIEL